MANKLIKTNIEKMIECNNIVEAKILLSEYKNELNVDYFSIMGIVEILEGNYLNAKEIFKQGLNITPDNYDLLYNINFLFKNYLNNLSEERRYYIWAKLFKINLEIEKPFICGQNNKIDIYKSSILHGTIEIANQMHTLVSGLSNLGLNAKSLNYYPSYLNVNCNNKLN